MAPRVNYSFRGPGSGPMVEHFKDNLISGTRRLVAKSFGGLTRNLAKIWSAEYCADSPDF